jgi:hypothetical protein
VNPPRELTDAEIMRGKLLSPETSDLLRHEIALLTLQLCSIKFPGDATERELAILGYVELQAKRNALIELVEASADTFRELSELESTSRN